MDKATREMSFEEEAKLYEEEACAEFAKESGYGDIEGVNTILRRGMRIVRKAREEIAHGVTVQDGKPLEEFLHPIDAYKGLKAKYLVFKADTGKVVENCFILRPDKDATAVEALRAYANATDNKTLAEDIYNWVGKGEPVQEWISVKDERKPKDRRNYFIAYVFGDSNMHFFGEAKYHAYEGNGVVDRAHFSNEGVDGMRVTHWMEIPKLPKPPKGE